MQAKGNTCKLRELHTSSGNWMQADGPPLPSGTIKFQKKESSKPSMNLRPQVHPYIRNRWQNLRRLQKKWFFFIIDHKMGQKVQSLCNCSAFWMHSWTFCMHSWTFCMHSWTFCMHSGTFCMHSGTFWNILHAFLNILHAFWNNLEHSACILEHSAWIL